ncbi:MAG: aldo/keto reductase [Pseudomonadota bacterium]
MTDLTMNDGRAIPAIGFGSYRVPPDEAERIARDGVAAGYRLADTAAFYANEAGVAAGIAGHDIFLTTKLWRDEMGYDAALRGFDASLAELGRESVDLYLVHWPMPSQGRYVETWKAFVRLRDEGRAKSIGVSNFEADHIRAIADATGVLPALNQVELHPAFQQRALRGFHAEQGIVIQSWAPLGQGNLLAAPAIAAVAKKHGATPAQAILAWHRRHGLATIPKASSPGRLAENLASLGLVLDADDMAAIDALDDPGGRMGPDPATM